MQTLKSGGQNVDSFQTIVEMAQEQQEYRRLRAQGRYDQMKGGPYLEPNGMGGQWVVIPSAWFNEEARIFWRKIDARFIRRERLWLRSVGLPYDGKRYTAQQWLRSLRKKFFEFHADELARAKEIFSTSTYRPLAVSR